MVIKSLSPPIINHVEQFQVLRRLEGLKQAGVEALVKLWLWHGSKLESSWPDHSRADDLGS